MSLPHAILTALIEKPSSGLGLARRFDKSIRYFWSATHQQIYRELGKLEEAGLIRAREGEVVAQGQRKTFDVLPAGHAELRRWVAEEQDPRPLRDPMLLRIRASAAVGGTDLVDELTRHLELHRRQLQHYREIEARDFSDVVSSEAAMQHLVLRAGVGLELFWTAWLADAIETAHTVAAQEAEGR
ncbi:PadR family transcriptional regulator [Antrihabitans sp. YC2-6]|uniref:PadR family transcriptional regulator n=1 Tax=Antrihabitans sp. YC2-6 TaxID=2799498 RepID=UPI0018F324EA|nr:PadR family transcriptional regulator [Antrihabitans sp. YC2-6]MBJ8347129.1 PadR family transcriptional regulator [Antrihabitans sp. YC2-6]